MVGQRITFSLNSLRKVHLGRPRGIPELKNYEESENCFLEFYGYFEEDPGIYHVFAQCSKPDCNRKSKEKYCPILREFAEGPVFDKDMVGRVPAVRKIIGDTSDMLDALSDKIEESDSEYMEITFRVGGKYDETALEKLELYFKAFIKYDTIIKDIKKDGFTLEVKKDGKKSDTGILNTIMGVFRRKK